MTVVGTECKKLVNAGTAKPLGWGVDERLASASSAAGVVRPTWQVSMSKTESYPLNGHDVQRSVH